MTDIEIDLPEDELLILFQEAHRRNQTFNDFVSSVIRDHYDDRFRASVIKFKELVDINLAIGALEASTDLSEALKEASSELSWWLEA